ncbi:MAG: ComEC/Rec2 family competence protein [Sulfurovum sp.]
MRLTKPKLFPTLRAFIYFLFFLFFILSIRLYFSYSSYVDFISKPFYYTYAKVITSYQKHKERRQYTVIKLLTTDGLTVYISSYPKQDFNNQILRVMLFPDNNISYSGYLGTFYSKAKIKKRVKLPPSFKSYLLQKVSSQHRDKYINSFYSAIFFATKIDMDLREKITLLGVNHLIALSGFHLGILWGVVYGLLLLLYRPFAKRFFPYRYELLDMGFVAIVLLGVYIVFVDLPPSLVRSYSMMLIGWVVLMLGMELFSFTFLFTVVALLVTLSTALLVSISFWLSVAGVFYIFLLLSYAQNRNIWVINLLIIPLGIFLFMLPIIHSIFVVTSTYQLLSPIISLLFIPFYPVVILFHLLGLGNIFDTPLHHLFELSMSSKEELLEWRYLLFYIILSFGAIINRWLFYLLIVVAFGYAIYIFG